MGTGPPCVEAIPPMPTDPQVVKRQELRSEERTRVREPRTRESDWLFDWPGSWPSREGWSQFCGRGSVQIRLMSDLIEEQSKEALFEFRPSNDIAGLIGARYGLEGEASNPGPPSAAPPISELCPDDVLADLTMLDSSDDEPLVIPRVGSFRAELV